MDTVVQQIITDAMQNIFEMSHGTVITHLSMENLLHTERKRLKNNYYYRVSLLRKLLQREYGIFLETQPKIGYRIKELGKEIDLVISKWHRGRKTMCRAVIESQLIRVNNLDENDKSKTLEISQKMANILSLTKLGEINKSSQVTER